MKPNVAFCVEFYYRVKGVSVDRLNVFLNSSGVEAKVFTIKGDQGDNWHHETLPMYEEPDKDLQVIL